MGALSKHKAGTGRPAVRSLPVFFVLPPPNADGLRPRSVDRQWGLRVSVTTRRQPCVPRDNPHQFPRWFSISQNTRRPITWPAPFTAPALPGLAAPGAASLSLFALPCIVAYATSSARSWRIAWPSPVGGKPCQSKPPSPGKPSTCCATACLSPTWVSYLPLNAASSPRFAVIGF